MDSAAKSVFPTRIGWVQHNKACAETRTCPNSRMVVTLRFAATDEGAGAQDIRSAQQLLPIPRSLPLPPCPFDGAIGRWAATNATNEASAQERASLPGHYRHDVC